MKERGRELPGRAQEGNSEIAWISEEGEECGCMLVSGEDWKLKLNAREGNRDRLLNSTADSSSSYVDIYGGLSVTR